jgi:phosphate transport system permease protein
VAPVRPAEAGRIEWLRFAAYGASALAAAVFAAMVGLFLLQSLPLWRGEGPAAYLLGARWFYRADEFGVLPMIYGTAVVSAVALALAAPVGLGAAVFTSELLPPRLRLGVKTVVELLAGVPSVVYGLLGVVLLRDWIFHLLQPFDPLSGDTLLTGGVLLSVMILPTVMTFADDALQGVPGAQRRAARGLGLSRAGTVLTVVVPRALPGLAAAVLLGLGRALGETIAVFLVVGRRDNQLPESVLSPGSLLRPVIEPGQTLTSKLGGSETFLAWGDPLHWAAIVGLALVLLAMVTAVTLVSGALIRRGGTDAATD